MIFDLIFFSGFYSEPIWNQMGEKQSNTKKSQENKRKGFNQ